MNNVIFSEAFKKAVEEARQQLAKSSEDNVRLSDPFGGFFVSRQVNADIGKTIQELPEGFHLLCNTFFGKEGELPENARRSMENHKPR